MHTTTTVHTVLSVHRNSAIAYIGPTHRPAILRNSRESDQDYADRIVRQIDWPTTDDTAMVMFAPSGYALLDPVLAALGGAWRVGISRDGVVAVREVA